ncbi:pentapeptide repeat-containing protein [Rothia sp. P7181]|uniref:pentapeptide repeat-containing protein n=1 Tax=Rothia sp. P7181 TaxID=3402663 RepID=UPI003AE82671
MDEESKQTKGGKKLEPPSYLTALLYSSVSGFTGLLFFGIVFFALYGKLFWHFGDDLVFSYKNSYRVFDANTYCKFLLIVGNHLLFMYFSFVVPFGFQYFLICYKTTQSYILRLINYIIPLFLLFIAICVCLVIWANTSGIEEWQKLAPEIITGVASLTAAVGLFASVAVNYQNHEENRKNESRIENEKRDHETIKALNERLHNILKNRNSEKEEELVSSYFQLAGLYKDWGLLGKDSNIIKKQRNTQQKYILKLIFGTVSQEDDSQSQEDDPNSENNIERSFREIATLNSVIADIFSKEMMKNAKESDFVELLDLQYVNFSRLNFSKRILKNGDFADAYFINANFAGADLTGSSFKNANLSDVNFAGADLTGSSFKDANLSGAIFDGAII